MADSVRPHRRQPTRLPRPWDSPGKNTGVGCHFFLQFMKVKSESEVALSCPALSNTMDCSLPGSSVHGIFQARVLEWGAIAFSIGVTKISSKATLATTESQRFNQSLSKMDSPLNLCGITVVSDHSSIKVLMLHSRVITVEASQEYLLT